MNIGVFVFAMLFLYIMAVSINYFTTHNISTYEVSYGTIINDTRYTGLILRTEEVYTAESSGYIQFYHLEGSKVSVGNYIYTIADSLTDTTVSSDSDEAYTLSVTDYSAILNTIQSFNSNYSSINFSDSYVLLDDLYSTIQNSVLDEQLSELDEILGTNSSIDIYTTDEVGIICYEIDGYESLTIDNFYGDSLDYSKYSFNKVSTGTKVSTNQDIYKLVTSEEWYIVFELNQDDIEVFEDITNIELKFLSDNETTDASISLFTEGENTYGIIALDTGMVRYISERYTEIEIILDELEGYKIPNTSIVTREFYEIPIEYITKGGDSSSNGILISASDGTVTFQETEIYYQTSEYVYIAADTSLQYQKIIMEETSEEMRLMETIEMDGVYVVNKGYAVFKCVDILTESIEYCIVDDSMSYSISNFDRIALYGDSVEEYSIIN